VGNHIVQRFHLQGQQRRQPPVRRVLAVG
jgi:hypothetical protein